MHSLRTRQSDAAKESARHLVARAGRELRIARVSLGITQADLGRRAGLPQSTISEVERGRLAKDLGTMSRLASALGLQLSVRFYPNGTIRLRDSGQLEIAQALVKLANGSWMSALEVPVGSAPDLRAADLILESPAEVLHVEIERNLADFQAQLRAGQLKRDALAQRYSQPVRLILALPSTVRLRRVVAAAPAISTALPKTTREVMASLRTGSPLRGDGLLWVNASSTG